MELDLFYVHLHPHKEKRNLSTLLPLFFFFLVLLLNLLYISIKLLNFFIFFSSQNLILTILIDWLLQFSQWWTGIDFRFFFKHILMPLQQNIPLNNTANRSNGIFTANEFKLNSRVCQWKKNYKFEVFLGGISCKNTIIYY